MGREIESTYGTVRPGAGSLSIDMKSALALMVSWIAFLFVGIAATVLSGPPDVYAVLSLLFAAPYLVFVYFGLRRRPWAYLGSSILSAAIILLIAASVQPGMTGLLIWETMFATLLASLIALEAFKGYLQCRSLLVVDAGG